MTDESFLTVAPAGRLAARANLVLQRKDDGTALLFDPGNSRLRQFNPYALAVWELLDGRREAEEILAVLAGRYADFDGVAEAQVLTLLGTLHDAGLLDESNAD